MLKTLIFVAIATVQCLEIKDPVAVDGVSPRLDWYYPPWSSIVDYFHKSDPEPTKLSPDLLTRVNVIEQIVKEMSEILKTQIESKKTEDTTTPRIKADASPPMESPSMTKKDEVPQADVQQPHPDSTKKPASSDNPGQTANVTKISTIALVEPTKAPEPARTNDN